MGQSIGEYYVGKSFNPSQHPAVEEIKAKAADLIDCIHRTGIDPRTRALAITNIEQGAMWGVKSATKPINEAPQDIPSY
jgi:hypothetical protein